MLAQTRKRRPIRFSWDHLSEHSVWVKNKNNWFEIGESYSFRSGSIGQGMGNEIFWSEIVKGLQGACTHPPPDIFFLRVFRSNLREVSLDSVASCTSEAFNSIFQIGFEIRLMSGIVPFFQMLAQTRKRRPIRFSWDHLSEHSVWVKNKNSWFEIGESYSFRSGLIGQGMGNGIFWSEMVKGLQGECTHPPPDVFLRVFRSNLREVSLDIMCCFLYLWSL